MAEEKRIIERIKGAFDKAYTLALRLTPRWMEAIGVGAFISAVVDRNPRFSGKLSDIDGKVFLFEATDIGKKFYLHVKDGDIKLRVHMPGSPDVVMRGEVSVLLGVFLGKEDPDTVFFSRRLEITGDTAAA
ncbi:MAG TPA: SCP2 sterol-binding domain-containing protein, partial [Thermodesulfobacteriota bacterium]|nr:SCP2 sterol-binding domain-containing protein [Thermodesulfobacteriota bacterium]